MKPFYVQRLNKPKSYPVANTPHLAEYYEARLTGPDTRDFISHLSERHRVGLDALNDLLVLDYMGSAEFEFGAVPKALRETFAKRDQYKRFTMDVSGLPVVSCRLPAGTAGLKPKSATLYGLAIPEHIEAIKTFVQDQTQERRTRLKEMTYLQEGCFGLLGQNGKTASRTVGWFDIENHWLLTTDGVLLDGFGHLLQINA